MRLAFASVLLLAGGSAFRCQAWKQNHHDAIKPLDQTPKLPEERLAARYAPSWHSEDGCEPYTLVDDTGTVSGGLNPTAGATAGCNSKDLGQIYVRWKYVTGNPNLLAILYVAFFPKSEKNDQRYHFLSSVIYVDVLDREIGKGQPNWIAFESSVYVPRYQDLRWDKAWEKKSFNDLKDNEKEDQDDPTEEGEREQHVRFKMHHDWLDLTGHRGIRPKLAFWDQLPGVAKDALNEIGSSLGEVDMPFNDVGFPKTLTEAWNAKGY